MDSVLGYLQLIAILVGLAWLWIWKERLKRDEEDQATETEILIAIICTRIPAISPELARTLVVKWRSLGWSAEQIIESMPKESKP